ncbi:MAG: YlxR family protein [Ruminococcaceae bacterium]|nr:YlxR family protein [Oscillospiraceae bacterium]
MAERKIPMRKCLGCNEMKPKKELIRAVKNSEGEVSLDLTGKKSGRGAYICPDKNCFQKARKGKRLEKALDTAIPDEVYDAMAEELNS